MPFRNAEIMARLGLAPEDLEELPADAAGLIEEHRRALAAALAHRSRPGDPMPPVPPAEPPLFAVHLILAALDDIRQCHREIGVTDDISWETLAHLGRAVAAYRARHARAGVALRFWDWLRYTGWLYQVGRLEATIYRLRTHPKEAGPLLWYDDETAQRLGLPFRIGDPALGIHIPAGEPLDPHACDESLRRMREGFPGRRVATCTSWLLDDQLAGYLPADSNIVRFQQRFQIVPGARDDDEAVLSAVFGPARERGPGALPRETALQRAAADHLAAGRHWRMRTGWLEL
jgi:GNAT domain-containint protein/N-acyltransferase family protein